MNFIEWIKSIIKKDRKITKAQQVEEPVSPSPIQNEFRYECGICKEKRPALPPVLKWCVHCQKYVCFNCWVHRNGEFLCPKCDTALRPYTEGELVSLLHDNPGIRRTVYMERACIPMIMSPTIRIKRRKSLLERILRGKKD